MRSRRRDAPRERRSHRHTATPTPAGQRTIRTRCRQRTRTTPPEVHPSSLRPPAGITAVPGVPYPRRPHPTTTCRPHRDGPRAITDLTPGSGQRRRPAHVATSLRIPAGHHLQLTMVHNRRRFAGLLGPRFSSLRRHVNRPTAGWPTTSPRTRRGHLDHDVSSRRLGPADRVTRTVLSCTPDEFHLHAQLDGYENNRRIHSQNWPPQHSAGSPVDGRPQSRMGIPMGMRRTERSKGGRRCRW